MCVLTACIIPDVLYVFCSYLSVPDIALGVHRGQYDGDGGLSLAAAVHLWAPDVDGGGGPGRDAVPQAPHVAFRAGDLKVIAGVGHQVGDNSLPLSGIHLHLFCVVLHLSEERKGTHTHTHTHTHTPPDTPPPLPATTLALRGHPPPQESLGFGVRWHFFFCWPGSGLSPIVLQSLIPWRL